MARKLQTLRTGLWRGVRTTDEPLDDGLPELLSDAVNGYLPDPETSSGFYARPGITVDRTFTNSTITQALFSIVLSTGTPYNFVFNNGVLSRSTSVGGALTTVTPTGVTISASATAIYVLPLADSFIVNDGVNLPWIATNLTSTPVTGTYLDYSTAAVLLSRGSTDTRIANSAFNYLLAGVNYSKTATAAGTVLPAGTIPANQWGVYRVSVNTAGTITVTAGAANYTTGYASESAAIAAVPATPAGEWNVGYFTVQTDVGNTFIAGTDALEGGASGNPANATNYYAGRSAPWQAFGQPVMYYGAVFFILATVDGSATDARTTIAWSEPNEPTVGYQQDDYDNAWTLTQTGSAPLFALIATNDALYYFRELSIGAVMGAPGVNFQGTATHDVVSGNVGTKFPRSPILYLNTIYFVDHLSRPWRYPVGGVPQPIWRQCRGLFEAVVVASGSPLWSVVEPSLSVVLLRVIQGAAGGRTLVFDAPTGIYLGRWEVTGSDLGVHVAGIHQTPTATIPPQVVLSEGDGTSVNSRLWQLNLLDGVTWQDSVSQQELMVQSGWLGYDAHETFRPVEARVLQYATNENVTVTVAGANGDTNTLAVAPKSGGATATGRVVLPLDLSIGRGVRITASPSVATYATQWRCYRVEVDIAPDSVATVEDR